MIEWIFKKKLEGEINILNIFINILLLKNPKATCQGCHVICEVLYIVLGYASGWQHNILFTPFSIFYELWFRIKEFFLSFCFNFLSYPHSICNTYIVKNKKKRGRKWGCSPRKSRATHTAKIPHTSWVGKSTRRIHTMRSRIPMEWSKWVSQRIRLV